MMLCSTNALSVSATSSIITRNDQLPILSMWRLIILKSSNSITLEFIKPGTPTQNSYVERFDRTYRDEILNMYVFRNLTEVRQLTEFWMTEYNDERPHDSLEDLTPWEYLAEPVNLFRTATPELM
jgi:putative transposase